MYPIFTKKKDKLADPNDEREVINNITGLVGFKMFINETYADTLTKLRNSNGVYQPLYEIIPLKGNIVISNVESFLSNSVTFKMVSTIGLPALLPLNADLKELNTKETKMKEATFELNDTFKMLEYLDANDAERVHPVSKRIQALTGEYPRPISIIRNMINSDDLADILIETNNNPEGFVTAINHVDGKYQATIVAYPNTKLAEVIEKQKDGDETPYKIYPRYLADDDIPSVIDSQSVNAVCTLHCFDYREVKPAKVLKFKK